MSSAPPADSERFEAMSTALIVEDEPDANELLAALVRLRQYQTTSVYLGSEAIEQAATHRPDVVLLDLMLPDLSGLEVCETLKANPETTLIPIIVVSAMLADENAARLYEAGANDYIAKPYTPGSIFDALDRAEAWAADLRDGPRSGSMRIDPSDRLNAPRSLSRLRSLLRAWTPLEPERITGIGRALGAIWPVREGDAGGDETAPGDAGASVRLRYELEPHQVVLAIEDPSRTLTRPEALKTRVADRAGPRVFDSIALDPERQRLELRCRH